MSGRLIRQYCKCMRCGMAGYYEKVADMRHKPGCRTPVALAAHESVQVIPSLDVPSVMMPEPVMIEVG